MFSASGNRMWSVLEAEKLLRAFLARFPERTILLSLFLAAASLWGFVEIADEVMKGDSQRFDERAVTALRDVTNPEQPLGAAWILGAARFITMLGGLPFIAIMTAAVIGFFAFQRRYHAAWLTLAAIGGGMLVVTLLKHGFARPRPSLVPHLTSVATHSFPSGHSMLSAVTYLTLAAFLAQATSRRPAKICILGVAVLLALAIGLSRIYLGVHYPTDVLAGWCAGLAWALICAVVARWLQRAGAVEPPAPVS